MYIQNENILDYIDTFECIYLIQTSGKLPTIFEPLRKKPFVLLSYKENTEDTTIYFPNSTWTTGRNKMREYVMSLEKRYNYYIFLDEDIVFSDYSQEDGFQKMEELLFTYYPYIANPNFLDYYNNTTFCGNPPLGEAQTTIWYDGMFNAFSKEAFFSNILFPYVDTFDSSSWWMSQYIMIMLCSLYKKEVVLFNHLCIDNVNHGIYPKEDVFSQAHQYTLDHLIKRSDLQIIQTLNTNSIFKIAEFLNIVLKNVNQLILVDVGCAIGDFKRLINHPNIYSIGIDPLIPDYKKNPSNILDSYSKLYDVCIDTKESKQMLNITSSLDTSSLKEFNREHITTDITHTSKFFIPENIYHFITDIIERREVSSFRLDSILNQTNINHQSIHILKIDAQGNDLNVLKSCGKYLKNVVFIVVESTLDESETLYKNTSTFKDDSQYLKSNGFELITKEVLLLKDIDCLFYNTHFIKDFDLNWDKKTFKQVFPRNGLPNMIKQIYNNLFEKNVIKQLDLDILMQWFSYFE